jgi:hypothetical protein
MACNLLSFQGLQAERRDSIPLRSTIQTVEISTVFSVFEVVGFGWKWL